MNYQFILMKIQTTLRHSFLWIIILLFSETVQGQIITPDSIRIRKEWYDENGHNSLTVEVNALCVLDKGPADGHLSKITALLENEKNKSYIEYDEKNFQMKMILFLESDISFYEINKTRAIFIPFFYCGNGGSDITVSYIIFYNNKKYLFHIEFFVSEDGICTLTDNIKKKAKNITSKKLRKIFVEQIETNYKVIQDFHFN